MAQRRLGTLAALVEKPGWVPITHVVVYNHRQL